MAEDEDKDQQGSKAKVREDDRSKRLRRNLDLVTLVLAVVAIVLACVQWVDSYRLKRDTRTILEEDSTKYVEEFPDNLPEIRKLVNRTCTNLDVLVDVPGYGMYSAPGIFREYYNALVGLRTASSVNDFVRESCGGRARQGDKKPDVRVLLFSPSSRYCSLRNQFDKNFLKTLQKNSETQSTFMTFVDLNKNLLNGESPKEYMDKLAQGGKSEYDRFIKYLLDRHHRVEEDLHGTGIQIRYANDSRPVVYMRIWSRDSAFAVFSFDHTPAASDERALAGSSGEQKAPGLETEIAFKTQDPQLLKTFHEIFNDHWNDKGAHDYLDYWKNPPPNPEPEQCSKDNQPSNAQSVAPIAH